MYTFTNTEINNKKCTEFETKSMLYLFGMHRECDDISIAAIDCFNDVTGLDDEFVKLWDVQSKNHSSLPPSKIGLSLSTLYDNFVSTISFVEYILFIPKLDRNYLVDTGLNTYRYDNIKGSTRKRIEKKLREKINGRKSNVDPPLFNDFLNSVTFVEDNKRISTYIKKMSRFKNKRSIKEAIYERIFVEIRNAQSSLKNSYIENKSINEVSEVIQFGRHITKLEINTLLISRLIGVDDVFSFPGIPVPFISRISGLDEEDVKDLLQECNENLSRAFFDKNGCREFWALCEKTIEIVRGNPEVTMDNTFDEVMSSVTVNSPYLADETIRYMISLIITGLQDES